MKREREVSSRMDDFFADGEGPSHFLFEGPTPPLALTDDMPCAKYRSRGRDIKTAVHWGQRKLLISEMQLLTYYCTPGVPYWIIYVGAAPGSHLLFLDKLYGELHTWELIDPGTWDKRFATASTESQKRRFHLRNEFFDNIQAYDLMAKRLVRAKLPALSALYQRGIDEALGRQQDGTSSIHAPLATDGSNAEAARTAAIPIAFTAPVVPQGQGLFLLHRVAAERVPTLFISDVRSGSEKECIGAGHQGDFEKHVHENMKAQEAWSDIINPTFAMLKFRLPYSAITKYDFTLKRSVTTPSSFPPETLYSSGDVVLPVWTRPTSTECRLVVPQYAPKKLYNHQRFEDQMFFFNAVLRERTYFDHVLQGHPWVTHHFDGSAEVALLQRFVQNRLMVQSSPREPPALTREEMAAEIESLCDSISGAIGGSFERAWMAREEIHTGKAQRGGWLETNQQRLEAAREQRSLPFWRTPLAAAAAQPNDYYVWKLRPVSPT